MQKMTHASQKERVSEDKSVHYIHSLPAVATEAESALISRCDVLI